MTGGGEGGRQAVISLLVLRCSCQGQIEASVFCLYKNSNHLTVAARG